jgi:tetratricopeptide (TPR) repeat protein
MLEHLHPTARGYYLIAHQFLAALEQSELFSGSVDKTQQHMWELIPLTAVDHHLAQYKVSQLTSDYPFTKEPLGFSLPPINSEEERFAQQQFNGATWLNQQQSLLSYYQQQQQWRDAAVVAGNLFEALQTNHQAAHAAGQLYRRAQQSELALFHARKAAELAPNNTQYKMNYAQLLAERGDVEASKQQLKAVLDINPDHENAKHYLALMEQRG